MKLQRYFQTEEKSWTRIGFEALLPLVAAKFIDKTNPYKIDITEISYMLGFLLKPSISMLLCIDQKNVWIRINDALLEKDNTFQHFDVHTIFVKDKTSLTQYCFETLKSFGTCFSFFYAICNPQFNTGLGISLVSLSLDTLHKLLSSNIQEIRYNDTSIWGSYYYKGDEYIGYFSPHIEWVGEADEDGYCEYVIKDSYGNLYEDIYEDISLA
jgi:hypothetical protein